MLIAIVGTRSSGKSTIEEFFVSNYSFTSVQIAGDEVHTDPGSEVRHFQILEERSPHYEPTRPQDQSQGLL